MQNGVRYHWFQLIQSACSWHGRSIRRRGKTLHWCCRCHSRSHERRRLPKVFKIISAETIHQEKYILQSEILNVVLAKKITDSPLNFVYLLYSWEVWVSSWIQNPYLSIFRVDTKLWVAIIKSNRRVKTQSRKEWISWKIHFKSVFTWNITR